MLDKQKLRAFVLGGLAGALAGVFFAPKSGKEFRGSIASRAGEARERSRETYFEAQERVQERISEARERSPRRGETRAGGATEDPLANLGAGAQDPVLDPEPPVGMPAGTPPPDPLRDSPPLRDVSRDMPRTPVGEDPDPEEIRRRIQETRSRLRRGRLDTPEAEDVPDEGHDG
jgi:YtxH-like protein